jgi:hypothetical protein
MRLQSIGRAHWLVICSLALAFAVLLFFGCSREFEPPVTTNPLFVDPSARDFSQNPELLEKLIANPHRYFRFVNIPFSQEVCRRFGHSIEGTPLFNLHGDAHIEQYAITDLGRGLTDFDDSSTGPAVVDLLRFGVSLNLACRGHECGSLEEVYDEFLRGYRAALDDPETEAPVPRVVQRRRAEFKFDRAAYFEWIASVMEPMPEEEKKDLAVAMRPYVEAMLEEDANLDSRYYEIVDVGYLRMGVGSALDLKYLVRIRGSSEEPLDDVVLEIKQVRELDEIECISVSKGSDPFRVLLGQSRIAYEPYGHLGYIRLRGDTFWIHAWVENYKEVEIGESFESPEELAEVAYDIGVQLGRGHPNQIGAPLDLQLRREQMRILERDYDEIKQAVEALSQLSFEAWQRFGERAKQVLSE